MARPKKNNVNYFPHNVKHGKKMSYIEKKYGNDGYATWFKILEELGDANNHYMNLSDEIQLMFLSDRCNLDEDKLVSIINDLVKLGEFNSEMWKHSIVFSEKFTESIKDAYKKRNNKCVDLDSLRVHLSSLGILKQIKSSDSGVSNTQSRVEYSKEDKTKVDKTLLSEIKISDLIVFGSETEKYELYFKQALLWQKLFIKNLKEKQSVFSIQEKAKFKSYVDPIRLMYTSDGVTSDQLKMVYKYLGSPRGEFWKANILSTSKLREKFPELIMRANEKKGDQPSETFTSNR